MGDGHLFDRRPFWLGDNEGKVKKTDLAYIAGIVDGEGCITLARATRKHPTSLCGYSIDTLVIVSNTNKWLLEYLKFAFGGSVRAQKLGENRKVCYHWRLSSRQAEAFLELILPYLHLKRPQAELALKFQHERARRGELGKHKKLKTDEELAVEQANFLLMRSYNRKGVH